MGTKTTMGELAALWQEMTAEERRNYRVRFGGDVLELISIETTGDQANVRGYQLNGPMATTQRDGNSRAARVRAFPLNLGGVEILDHDEPVDNDDPGPPPTLRPADDLPDPDSSGVPWKPSDVSVLPGHEGNDMDPPKAAWEHFEEIGPLPLPRSITYPSARWAGDPDYMPSVLDTPVETWASTAIRMPHELLDRASKEAKRRGIGRNVLLAHLVEQALNGIEGRPLL